ncbi:DUF5316 domain-containing protein [Priestia flexa]|jgi:uncharacterized membrane protein|uniref:Uncharacterized protein n=1 Tax=Priestia flexa TaxID=86664 RepID=A0A8I1MH74_9BACI|nr:DUF5316 family protein [Priestia flexa]MBN8252119.1 hypothetical protein [Priestia flexa]MBN8435071.1 hypothetical protein [Priestia flexa]MCA0967426.1 DUF5316 domain-containing protein [Priestia flexa]UIR31977.1 DUF5316 domain-containing protein [Priestia flexa]UZW65283.1 DUF5316 domain-containing protein [Priestia flexa]
MVKLFLVIGIISIIISGISIGAWVNGEQQRANFHSETAEHRSVKTKVSMVSGLVGFLALSIARLIYFL